jgi:CubicO group peptidase (beta-lactamase class C family)
VCNLLSQNSGLPVYEGRRGDWDDDQADTALETGIRQLSTVTLNHPAGRAFEYANENYTTRGLIVQAVSAHSNEDYVRTNIFAPLQMSHSAAALTDLAAQDIATGYRYWFLWPVAFDAPYPRGQTLAGFLISSAEDMSHYLLAGPVERRCLRRQSDFVSAGNCDTSRRWCQNVRLEFVWDGLGCPGSIRFDQAGTQYCSAWAGRWPARFSYFVVLMDSNWSIRRRGRCDPDQKRR